MITIGSPSGGTVREYGNSVGGPLVFITAGSSAGSALWPEGAARAQSAWGEQQYRSALGALANMHAAWWGRPSTIQGKRWEPAPVWRADSGSMRAAREALLAIEEAHWGERFLPRAAARSWLRLLDDPGSLLSILAGMPQTLIHGDHGRDRLPGGLGSSWGPVGVGPAPYDLACFYSSSRWWFGRLPLSLTEMRNWYLQRLNERLDAEEQLDRYTFDLGFDAALAWRFAIHWPALIMEHHTILLAGAHHLRAAVIEPACASLRRCTA
jgi:hypothetical protein